MPSSPATAAHPVILSITSNGRPYDEIGAVISINVILRVNRIPVARIVLADGRTPEQDFPLSDAETFKPGAEIVIKAGYEEGAKQIFKGVITGHGLKHSGGSRARLVIECRHPAVKMTIPRKNAVFADQTDSETIESLIGAYNGLSADTTSTSVRHGEMVQYYCSDWDYMLARAEANGQLVIVEDGKITVGPPKTSGASVLEVTYGEDLMEFRADIDVRSQLSAVEALAWDPAIQKNATASASPAELNNQGNLGSSELAEIVGPSEYRLQTSTPVTQDSLEAWAKGAQLKAGLARIRGRMKFQGSALAVPGALIELDGVGSRFNGQVYVSAVHHRIQDGEWITEVQFGLDPAWFVQSNDVEAPSASGYLPGITGLHIGIVTRLDEDPGRQFRIQVRVPVLGDERNLVWARLAQTYASDKFGAFYVPEIDDEVILGFFNDDPTHPVVLGSLYSSKNPPPHALTADNNIKGFLSRERLRLECDEEKKSILIETPAGNRVVLNEEEKSIRVEDQNGNTMTLSESGIAIASQKDIEIRAGGKIDIAATGPISVKSDDDVSVEGVNIEQTAQAEFTAQGSASAEVSSSGQTTVKGAMVMIN